MLPEYINIFFGVDNNYIEVTKICCQHFIKNNNLFIKRETRLPLYFGDPCRLVKKNIIIKLHGQIIFKASEANLIVDNIFYCFPNNNNNNNNIIVRILSNIDIPFKNKDIFYNNLNFILENESSIINTDRLYILNRLYDNDAKKYIISLLEKFKIPYIEFFFCIDTFTGLVKTSNELLFTHYPLSEFQQYLDNINQCYNYSLNYAQKTNYHWVMVLTNNVFLTNSLFLKLINNREENTNYVIIKTYKISEAQQYCLDNLDLLDNNQLQQLPGVKPQIMFKITNNLQFDHSLSYIYKTRKELFRLLETHTKFNNLTETNIQELSSAYYLSNVTTNKISDTSFYQTLTNNILTNKLLEDKVREYLNSRDNLVNNSFNLSYEISYNFKKIIVVSVYYNYSNNIFYKYNYKLFRDRLHLQGVKLKTLELYLNTPEINQYTEVDAIKIHDVMWYKENALNYLINNLDSEYEIICWLDMDIILLDNDWIIEVYNKLLIENYEVVQLFKYMKRMSITNYYNKSESITYGFNNNEYFINCVDANNIIHQADGAGWAIKASVLKRYNGLYDKCILGGGDTIMKHIMLYNNIYQSRDHFYKRHQLYNEDISDYFNKALIRENNKATFINNIALHLYHGNYSNRNYNSRYKIVKQIPNFDPKTYLVKENGLYNWNRNTLDLETIENLNTLIIDYFNYRDYLSIILYTNDLTIINLFKMQDNIKLTILEKLETIHNLKNKELIILENISPNILKSYLATLTNEAYILLLDYSIIGTIRELNDYLLLNNYQKNRLSSINDIITDKLIILNKQSILPIYLKKLYQIIFN